MQSCSKNYTITGIIITLLDLPACILSEIRSDLVLVLVSTDGGEEDDTLFRRAYIPLEAAWLEGSSLETRL